MKRHFENLTSRASRAVQHWWALLLAGILSVAAGIVVFVFPSASYVTLSVIAGILMLVVGTSQLLVALTSGNYLAMRGYILAGGVVDILLGIFLCIWPSASMGLLSIMLGIWMMYHSFMLIALGGDMDTFRIDGGMWTVVGGLLLLVLSVIVLLNPFSAGVATVIVFAGVGLVLLGLLLCMMSVVFRDLHKSFE